MPKIRHIAFPQEGLWRIVWFGRLTGDEDGNLLVNTHFARLDGGASIPIHKKRHVSRVPIGEIPRLYINAVIQDGVLDTDVQLELREWKINSRTANCHDEHVSFRARTEMFDGELIIPDDGGAQFLGSDGGALIAYFDFDDGGCPLAIPSIELFRFFYATSTTMAHIATNGTFLRPEGQLWSDYDIDPDKRASIVICKSMLDADVRMIACFALSPYARFQAQRMYLNAAPDTEIRGFIAAWPPIPDTVELSFVSKIVKGGAGPIELVSRILSCNWSPPYTQLTWRREQDTGGATDDTDDEGAAGDSLRKMALPDDSDIQLLLDRPSSQSLLPKSLIEEEINRRFPRLEETPVERLSRDGRGSGAKRETKTVFVPVDEASTLDATNSEERVNRTNIVRDDGVPEKKTEPAPDIRKADYEDILGLLKIISDSQLAEVHFLELLGDSVQYESALFNVYPKLYKGRQRAWLYADEAKTSSRVILVARIERQGRIRYVFELQRREKRKSSTLLVWREGADSSPIVGYVLSDLCFEYAAAGAATLESASRCGVSWARKSHTLHLDELEPPKRQAAAERLLEHIFSAPPIAGKIP